MLSIARIGSCLAALALVACASQNQPPEQPQAASTEPTAEPDAGPVAEPEHRPTCPEGRFQDEVFGCQTCPRFFFHDEIFGWCTRWIPAGRMSLERSHHTATLLNNNRVLLVGGVGRDGRQIAKTTLFDPVSTSWSEGPPLAEARWKHTTSLLEDGRVLVVGGRNGPGALSSVEIFDPRTDTWSPGPPLKTARAEHAMVKLADGRHLVVGGGGSKGILKSVEIFDESESRWRKAASLPDGRRNASATLLPDGSVALVGGARPPPSSTGVLNLLATDRLVYELLRYDPSTNHWTKVGRFPVGIAGNAAAMLGSELIVVPALRIGLMAPERVGIFRIDPQTWTIQVDHPNTAGASPRVAPQASGLVAVIGPLSHITSVEPEATARPAWIPSAEHGVGHRLLAPMMAPRSGHTLTTLADGRLLAAGGTSNVAETHRAEVMEWVQGLRNSRVPPADDPFRPRPLDR